MSSCQVSHEGKSRAAAHRDHGTRCSWRLPRMRPAPPRKNVPWTPESSTSNTQRHNRPAPVQDGRPSSPAPEAVVDQLRSDLGARVLQQQAVSIGRHQATPRPRPLPAPVTSIPTQLPPHPDAAAAAAAAAAANAVDAAADAGDVTRRALGSSTDLSCGTDEPSHAQLLVNGTCSCTEDVIIGNQRMRAEVDSLTATVAALWEVVTGGSKGRPRLQHPAAAAATLQRLFPYLLKTMKGKRGVQSRCVHVYHHRRATATATRSGRGGERAQLVSTDDGTSPPTIY